MIPSSAVTPALSRAALKATAGGAKTLYDSFHTLTMVVLWFTPK